ncbi:AraC family transcriptional regulator [Cohnella zeiphila]|uniref:AraC family transcriptional regulator n=1 Tax=Cohnella zeiphila TaxID=2761120 RepID=A0A7X0VVS1_9BACL|nr:AraC family transcriptional regulator [Cohnella zeiphila]MBB6730178.1 AraC family transcriptional regulator [Cohnella zeiphila]
MSVRTLSDLAPALNFASRDTAEPGERWGPRANPDCQLFHVVSGEAVLRLGGEELRIRPGESVFYPEGAAHLLTVVRRTDYFSLHFRLHAESPQPVHPALAIRELPWERLTGTPEPVRLAVDGRGEIAVPHRFELPGSDALLMRMVQEYRQELPGSALLLRALTAELILTVVRHALARHERGRLGDRLEPAIRAMTEQPARDWTVAELADLCGYHPSYFTKVFRESFGRNPKAFLVAERIKRAKQALLRGETTERAAERLGYASVHYFSNNFKKMTGMTPGEFRQLPESPSEREES